MAIYPNGTYRPLTVPNNDPPIIPVGAILHVSSTESVSLWSYFNGPSGGIESHFYIRYDGTTEQYRNTGQEADANLKANSFLKDGKRYGFVSIETEGRDDGEWTSAQLAEIKRLLTWLSVTHNFPLRKCPGPFDAGVGYHTLFGAPGPWTPVAKSCPGPNRIKQFNAVLVPWMATSPTQPQEGELSATDAQRVIDYAEQVSIQIQKHIDQVIPPAIAAAKDEIKTYTAACTTSVKDYVRQTDDEQDILNALATQAMDVRDLKAAIATLVAKVDALPKA